MTLEEQQGVINSFPLSHTYNLLLYLDNYFLARILLTPMRLNHKTDEFITLGLAKDESTTIIMVQYNDVLAARNMTRRSKSRFAHYFQWGNSFALPNTQGALVA